MAYDLVLAERLREAVKEISVTEKKMFGGVAFLLNGNMMVGIHGDNLIARVGLGNDKASLTKPYTKPFDMTGHPMSGWVEVLPAGCKSDQDLKIWVMNSLEFVSTLPKK